MKKTYTVIAALLLIGAGYVGWWNLSQTDLNSKGFIHPFENTLSSVNRQRPTQVSEFESLIDSSIAWRLRVDRLRNIEVNNLGQEDINALYELLNHQPVLGQEESWWVVVNEIMEQLRLNAIAPDRYSKEMLAIIRSPAAPEVLRDYAVQHLGQWVTPRGSELGRPSEQNPELVRETAETLVHLVTDPKIGHTTIPGTTLMVLVDMKSGGFPDGILSPALEELHPWFEATINGKNNTKNITRISAINSIGMLGLENFRDDVRTLVSNDAEDASIRLSSIAALGQIGEQSDLEVLQVIAHSDSKFSYAAKSAIENLVINENIE